MGARRNSWDGKRAVVSEVVEPAGDQVRARITIADAAKIFLGHRENAEIAPATLRKLSRLHPAVDGMPRIHADISVSLDVLIERLVLSPELPEWAVEPLTVVIRKLGLECPIEKSSLVT